MARKGTFGSKLTPFGGGAFSDLSVYRVGAAPAPQAPEIGALGVLPRASWGPKYTSADPSPLTPTPLTPTPFLRLKYTAADPPHAPSVAPEIGVLPQPVLPQPTPPRIYLNPDTSAAREETGPLSGRMFDRLRQSQFGEARLLAELLAADG